MKVTINSRVEHGKLQQNRKLLQNSLEQFEGKDVTITIAKKRKTRSNEQNAYYWGCIIPIVQNAISTEWGHKLEAAQVHEFLKGKFNYTEVIDSNTGELIKLPKSTTLNSTTEQMEYYTEINNFMQEYFNITLPAPNEQIEIEI